MDKSSTRKMLQRRYNLISLLYLLVLTAKASGLSACQGTPQTISISRGQKIAVVYWVGDNQSGDEEEEESTVNDFASTTIVPEDVEEEDEGQNEQVTQIEVEVTTELPEYTTEGAESVLKERVAVTDKVEGATQGLKVEEAIATTLPPKFDEAKTQEPDQIDAKSDVNQNETTLSPKFDQSDEGQESTIAGKSDASWTIAPDGREDNETIVARNEDNNSTIVGKNEESINDNSTLIGINDESSTIENDDSLNIEGRDGNNSTLSGKSPEDTTENIEDSTSIIGRNDNTQLDVNETIAVGKSDDSSTLDGRSDILEELSTIAGKSLDDLIELSTFAGRNEERTEETTDKPAAGRSNDDQPSTTLTITESDVSNLNNRFRSVEEDVTEVKYWSSTPAFEDVRPTTDGVNEQPRASLLDSQSAAETSIDEQNINVEQSDSASNDSLSGKNVEFNDTFVESDQMNAALQSTETAIDGKSIDSVEQSTAAATNDSELQGKQIFDSTTIAFDGRQSPEESPVTENSESEVSSSDDLSQRSLFDSLATTIKAVLKSTFSATDDEQEQPTTDSSVGDISFKQETKDSEIIVDPSLRPEDRYNVTEVETPPTITIVQLGDKVPKAVEEEEEPLVSSSSSLDAINEKESPATTVVSIVDSNVDDAVQEEARKVVDNSPSFDFIPLEVIGGRQPLFIQRSPSFVQRQSQPETYVQREDSPSGVAGDYYVPANIYSRNVNRFRIPQSRVHYVSMLRPPDGILPMQSLNLDSGFKTKRRRILQRGGRTKRETNGTHCEWVFKSEPGVPLLLTFKSFSTPETEVCQDHYISVERESNGFISRWCGVSGDRPGHAAFARSEIRLQLHSSGDGTFPTGFSVEVQALDLKLLRKYAEVRRIVKGQ